MLRALLRLCLHPSTALVLLLALPLPWPSTASAIPFTLAHIDLTARAPAGTNLSTGLPATLPQTHYCQGTFGGFFSSDGAHYLPPTSASASASGNRSDTDTNARIALNVSSGAELSAVFYINAHGGYTCASRFALGLVPRGKTAPESILSMDWAGQVGIDGRSSSSMRVRADEVPQGEYDAHFFQYVPDSGRVTAVVGSVSVDMTGGEAPSGDGTQAKPVAGGCVCPDGGSGALYV